MTNAEIERLRNENRILRALISRCRNYLNGQGEEIIPLVADIRKYFGSLAGDVSGDTSQTAKTYD